VQITLRVTADELTVLGERDVALDDAGTLDDSGLVGLQRVLRELKRIDNMSKGFASSAANA
jgi:hypothetical protein